jgi:rod shape-determining protein MreD
VRGVAYVILAYLALGVQVGLSGFIRVGGAPPNLVLLAALLIALNAPKEPALLGCFGLGLMQDLLTQQTLGMYALSYGLIAMFVMSTQAMLNREHPVTHLCIAFIGCSVCAAIFLLHDLLRSTPDQRIGLTRMMYTTLYTTALSPIVLGILQKLRRSFGFQTKRVRTV